MQLSVLMFLRRDCRQQRGEVGGRNGKMAAHGCHASFDSKDLKRHTAVDVYPSCFPAILLYQLNILASF